MMTIRDRRASVLVKPLGRSRTGLKANVRPVDGLTGRRLLLLALLLTVYPFTRLAAQVNPRGPLAGQIRPLIDRLEWRRSLWGALVISLINGKIDHESHDGIYQDSGYGEWLDSIAELLEARPGLGLLSVEGGVEIVDYKTGRVPAPGDPIIGYITRGRGVSIHRADCPNVADLERDPDRFVPVDWSGDTTASFLVSIQIEALDRKHLLRDITAVLGDLHINITSAHVATRRDRVAVRRFSFELGDPTHLEYALLSVRRVEGVYDPYRVVPQQAGAG